MSRAQNVARDKGIPPGSLCLSCADPAGKGYGSAEHFKKSDSNPGENAPNTPHVAVNHF